MFARSSRRLLLLSLAVGCSSPTAPQIEGTWGGTQASLSLTPTDGSVAYPCGVGIIDSAWTLDNEGKFAATGQHFFGGGPIPPEGRAPHPVQYSGVIVGAHLILTVTVTDLNQTLGPFRMVRNGPPVYELCK